MMNVENQGTGSLRSHASESEEWRAAHRILIISRHAHRTKLGILRLNSGAIAEGRPKLLQGLARLH